MAAFVVVYPAAQLSASPPWNPTAVLLDAWVGFLPTQSEIPVGAGRLHPCSRRLCFPGLCREAEDKAGGANGGWGAGAEGKTAGDAAATGSREAAPGTGMGRGHCCWFGKNGEKREKRQNTGCF